jgi:Xaa-Pro aminopeptidase
MRLTSWTKVYSLLALCAILLCSDKVRGQDIGHEIAADTLTKYGVYDTDLLPPSFHAGRRSAFLDSMQSGSLALFVASPERTRANDVSYQYHPDPNFYYLTGCWEPGSALVMSKDPIFVNGHSVHEVLFVRQRDPKMEVWTGTRLGPQGAESVLRVAVAEPVDSLEHLVARLLNSRSTLYYHRSRAEAALLTLDSVSQTTRYPALHIIDPQSILGHMRMIKQTPELRLMRKAIAISNEAHNTVIRQAQPGWHEYNAQAIAESTFLSNGAEYTAYPCIVGSGTMSTILHYETNRKEMKAGDFVEMDMGAEYHGYAADITRSFPVSRRFSDEQRAIYDIVLEAQDSGIHACQVGANFFDAHRAAVGVITRGLLRLGIIKDSGEYRRYFMHGTSHFLGLDVHDAGDVRAALAPGMVMTVEPGIYIHEGSPCDKKWWNIGCRVEDDILITKNGPENLSSASPRSIDAVEALRNQAP